MLVITLLRKVIGSLKVHLSYGHHEFQGPPNSSLLLNQILLSDCGTLPFIQLPVHCIPKLPPSVVGHSSVISPHQTLPDVFRISLSNEFLRCGVSVTSAATLYLCFVVCQNYFRPFQLMWVVRQPSLSIYFCLP